MCSERSVHVEHDTSGEVQEVWAEVELALEQRHTLMMYAIRGTIAEFIRNNVHSEPHFEGGGRYGGGERGWSNGRRQRRSYGLSAFKAEDAGGCSDDSGEEEPEWQVGEEA